MPSKSVVAKRNKIATLFEQQDGLCYYCKTPMRLEVGRPDGRCDPDLATIEHLTPKARGGTLSYANTVAACFQCNNDRGDGKISARLRAQGPQAKVVWQDD